MKVVLQRVKNASVTASGEEISGIGTGLLLLVGIARGDGEAEANWLAENTQDETQITYRFVEYDVEKAQGKIRAAGLPGMLADRLALGR